MHEQHLDSVEVLRYIRRPALRLDVLVIGYRETYLLVGNEVRSHESGPHLVGWQDAQEVNGRPLGRTKIFLVVARFDTLHIPSTLK